MVTINNDKLQIGHNISIREFMFDAALSEYEEKYGKLNEDEKKAYREKYHENQKAYIEHNSKEVVGEKAERLCRYYNVSNLEDLTEHQIHIYYAEMLEGATELIPIINNTFAEKPDGEKIEPVYRIEDNTYTKDAVNKWNTTIGDWEQEKDLLQGVSYMHLYTQFLFHQFIEDYNRKKIETKNSKDVITTSKAIELSKKFEKILAEEGEKIKNSIEKNAVAEISEETAEQIKNFIGMDDDYILSNNDYIRYRQHIVTPTNRNNVMQAIDRVFRQETGSNFFSSNTSKANVQYDSVRNRFQRMLNTEDNEFKDYIPLSPYDPLFAKKEVFLRNGCELIFVRTEELEAATQDRDIKTYRYHRDKHVRSTYDRRAGSSRATLVPFENFEDFVSKGRYSFETENDRSHLSALLPYISKKELDGENLRSLNKYINEVDDQYKMSKKGIERSVAILQHLQDKGMGYTIVKGMEPGELDAKITGTPYTIKVVVKEGREKFLGNLYNSKTTMRIRLGIDANNDKAAQLNHEYSVEDTLNMIDYVLGAEDIGNMQVAQTDKKIGTIGSYNVISNNNKSEVYNEAYYIGTNAGFRFTINTRLENGQERRVLVNMDHMNHYERPMDFNPPSSTKPENRQAAEIKYDAYAENYLRGAIQSAILNFAGEINIEKIIEEYKNHKEDPEYTPEFSHDVTTEAIQRFYWERLNSDQENENGEKQTDIEKFEWVRQHFNEYIRTNFGTYEPDPRDGHLRFDAHMVASYMTSDTGTVGNRENIVRAMKRLNIPSQELRGNEYQNQAIENRMLKFHPSANSEIMLQSQDPFVRDIGQTIKNTLLTTGCSVEDADILIDENGMVQVTAKRRFNRSIRNGNINEKPFTAQIGQIFIPDEDGMIKTKYAGTENYATIPGNEIYVVGKNQDGPLKERIRVRTYKDMIQEQATVLIREALYSGEEHYENSIGFSSVYSKLKSEHLPLNYKEEMIESGMDKNILKAIMETSRLQCTWANPSEVRENATLLEDYRHSHIREAADGTISVQQLNEIVNDNFRNTYDIMGRNNISQLGHWCDGVFDLSMTSGAKNQGINIYLNPDAKIAEDGSIIPAEDIHKKVPILEYMRYCDYDAWDRIQMTSSNFMRSLRVAEKVKTAQMEFGGWTFDDGYVVSKEFAEKHMVKDKDGNKRPLQTGDKISDNHGNKGVISLIVDREADLSPISLDYIEDNLEIDFESFQYDKAFGKMRGTCRLNGKEYLITTDSFKSTDFEQIKDQIYDTVYKKENEYRDSLRVPVDWFKANPDLEVVGAPYSPVSRFNAGSAKELAENSEDLVDPYNHDRKMKYSIGEADYIITPMTVDKKTHTYGKNELEEGSGRSVSAQLGWALNSQGADKVMEELYGTNNASFANFREYLISFGLDIDNVGNFKSEYTPQIGEERNIARLDAIDFSQYIEHKTSKNPLTGQIQPNKDLEYRVLQSKRNEAKAQFAKQLDTAGFMEVPFQIKMANGELTPQLENGNYRLPVLAKHLRSEQSFLDGRSSEHEYTKNYTQIFSNILDYKLAEKNLEFFRNKNDGNDYSQEIKKYTAALKQAKNKSQASYDRVVDSLVERKFSTKTNFIKEHIMSNKVENSATAVWTANPTLDIDQVAVSPDIAKDLNLVDEGYVLVWRDPMLRDEGIRYMRVKIDDNIKSCVSINPAMDKPFDGDFDGDTIGLAKLNGKEAIKQAKELLSVDANLLDHGTGGEGKNKELTSQESLDIKSVEHGFPEVKERFNEITEGANRIEETYKDDFETLKAEREKMTRKISDLYRSIFEKAYIDERHNPNGCHNAWDKEQKEHVHCLEHMVSTGAKGNISKLREYSEYLGVAFEVQDDKIVEGSMRVYDKPFGMYDDTTPDSNGTAFNKRYRENGKLMTAEEAQRTKKLNTQIATTVKSIGTGIAGAYSQRGMRALRNLCPRAILEMTYPETQGVLQAKHDEKEARIKFEALMGVARKAWNAEKMEKYVDKDGVEHWRSVTDAKHNPIKVTYGEFIDQLKDVCSSKDGLNVKINTDYISEIANYMVDPEDVAKQKEMFGEKFDITKCRMRGIEDEDFLQQYESPMDKLAYSYGNGRDTIEILKELADPEANNGSARNLFEGKNNKLFMPSNVRYNVRKTELAHEKDTEEMHRTKDAIDKALDDARRQGISPTREEIAQGIIERGESGYKNSTIKKAISAVNKENAEKITIQAKETQTVRVEANQQKALRKRQENLGLNDIVVDQTQIVQPVVPVASQPNVPIHSASEAINQDLKDLIDEIENTGEARVELTEFQ